MTIIQKSLDKERNVIRFSVPNRTIKFYTIRKSLIGIREFDFLKTSGVYILFPENFEKIVYIGETDRPDGMQARIIEHINEKDPGKKKNFEWITFIVSSDPTQPISSIRFKLEYSLIDDYKPGKNTSLGKPSRLGEDEYEYYVEIYEMIKEFLDQVYHIKSENEWKESEEEKETKGKGLIDDLGLKKGDYVYFLRYWNKYYPCFSKSPDSHGAVGLFAYRGKVESNYLIGGIEYFDCSEEYVKSNSYRELYTIDAITNNLYNNPTNKLLKGYSYWGLEDGTALEQLAKRKK